MYSHFRGKIWCRQILLKRKLKKRANEYVGVWLRASTFMCCMYACLIKRSWHRRQEKRIKIDNIFDIIHVFSIENSKWMRTHHLFYYIQPFWIFLVIYFLEITSVTFGIHYVQMWLRKQKSRQQEIFEYYMRFRIYSYISRPILLPALYISSVINSPPI